MRKLGVLVAILIAATFAASAGADPIPATYTTAGTTTGTGPWDMTSTDVTFAVLRFVPTIPIMFADWTSLIVEYENLLGGIGGGAPRFTFVLDANGDTVSDGTFHLHWGPPGTFTDPTLGPGSTGNLLALTDVGRYDLGGVGGSAYTDRAAALALVGTHYVLRASLVLDSFGGHDRHFIINSIMGEGRLPNGSTAPVPEPGSLALVGVMMVGGFYLHLHRRRRRVVA